MATSASGCMRRMIGINRFIAQLKPYRNCVTGTSQDRKEYEPRKLSCVDLIRMDVSKRMLLLTVCLLCFVFSAFSQEILYEGESNGVMMLQVSEFNIKKKDAVPQAIKDAYFQILFRGIPGSKEHAQALLGTDETIMNNQKYYDTMINDGRLYSFITYSALNYYKKKEAVVKLSINVQALISDLERNNLYRRFGLY